MTEKYGYAEQIVQGCREEKRGDSRAEDGNARQNEGREQRYVDYRAGGANEQIKEELHGQWRMRRAIVQDTVQGPQAVAPADFLAFLIAAGLVMDGAFVHAAAGTRHQTGDLWFKAEAVLAQTGASS